MDRPRRQGDFDRVTAALVGTGADALHPTLSKLVDALEAAGADRKEWDARTRAAMGKRRAALDAARRDAFTRRTARMMAFYEQNVAAAAQPEFQAAVALGERLYRDYFPDELRAADEVRD